VSTRVNNVANNGPELLAREEAVSEPAHQDPLPVPSRSDDDQRALF
jgi:hypothetical protein